MWDALWTFLLSPLGASIVATLLAFALGKLLLAKPQWAPWKGIIIEGINTNIPLHQRLLEDAAFRAGGTDIHYLENKLGLK